MILKKLISVLFISSMLYAVASNADDKVITAKSFLVVNYDGEIILEKNADRIQPIASITKLMTVITVLTAKQDLDERIRLDYSFAKRYHTHLSRSIKTLTRGELIKLAVVKSDNFAAITLANNYPGGSSACIYEMNAEAIRLGMFNTVFADPTGLNDLNTSNAFDLVKLVTAASKYSEIINASNMSLVEIQGTRKHHWQFVNTNPLVRNNDGNFTISKTGFTRASGGCIVMLVDLGQGERIIVLLGSKNTRTRIPEAKQIASINNSSQWM